MLFDVVLHVFLLLFFFLILQLALRVDLYRVIIVSPTAELETLHYKMRLKQVQYL